MSQINGELIGKGMMADVYSYNGYAYKCFHEFIPDDFIAYEERVQGIIHNAGLPAPALYKSEIPRSIKMQLVAGKTLAAWMLEEGYPCGLEDVVELFPKIHSCSGLELPDRKQYMREKLQNAVNISDYVRDKALRSLETIPDSDTLCHNDFHFLNIISPRPRAACEGMDIYTIIDWVSAMNGDPILDYARTYILLYEFANALSDKYLQLISSRFNVEKSLLENAIYACAVHRLTEYDALAVRGLIDRL